MQHATISTEPLTDEERTELRHRADRDGDATVAKRMGVSRNTFPRLVAGLKVNKPTVIAARVHLAQKW